MKVGILAGGRGTRLAGETQDRPKPLAEVGGRPILWHVMKHYAHFGFCRFTIALGYRGEMIREYFRNGDGRPANDPGPAARDAAGEDWKIDLVDTGLETGTGGRIKRLMPYLGGSTFMLTWSDGVSDVDLARLLEFHRSHGRLATVTAVHPPPRFGRLSLRGNVVQQFAEKPPGLDEWINGAFFVLEPGVFDYIEADATMWEREPMERLARDGQLMAYKHESFWQCMDTPRDKIALERMWAEGKAPWAVWR